MPLRDQLISALSDIPQPNDEQLEALEQCHNPFVGHGGLDRTMTKLFSLGYIWDHMRQHDRMFIDHLAVRR